MALLVVYMIPAIIIDSFHLGFSLTRVIATIIYYLTIALLFLFFRRGKILFVTNALMIASFVKAAEFIFTPEAFDFYMHIALSLLIVATIYVRKFQVYICFTVLNLMTISRIFIVNGYISEGVLSPNAMAHTGHSIFGALFFTLTARYIMSIVEEAIQKSETLESLAETDPLTGLGNRRKLEQLHSEGTPGIPRVVAVLDLDYFKKVNDDFGHDTGDLVLQRTTDIISSTIRGSDTCYRWGGEEFVAVLNDISLKEGILIAERLRKKVETCDFEIGRTLTISIGLTCNDEGSELTQLLKEADKAMYQAKKSGRNRVVAAE